MTSQAAIGAASVTIRRLTVDDLELLRGIRAEALQKYPQAFGSLEEDQGGDAMVAAYRRWLSGTLLGAFECQNLVGPQVFMSRRTKDHNTEATFTLCMSRKAVEVKASEIG